MVAHYPEDGRFRQFLRNQSGGISHAVVRRRLAFAICAAAVVGIALYLVMRSDSDSPAAPSQTPAPGNPVTNRTPAPKPSQARSSPPADGGSATGSAPSQPPPTPSKSGIHLPADRTVVEVDDAILRGDLNKARTLAAKVLERDPTNPRMMQVMAYVACAHHELKEARNYYGALTDPKDRARVESLCRRRGVELDKPPMKSD